MINYFKDRQYPYSTLNEYYRKTYGEKVYKIAIDAGFTCPNRDGLIDSRGCIYCSQEGSGDFARSIQGNILEEISKAKALIQGKLKAKKFIVYFQAYTNTYGPVNRLKDLYESAIQDPAVVGLSIATRPDCLDERVLDLLEDLSKKTDVYVELGLQTIHAKTADFIRRGYELSVYDQSVNRLKSRHIKVVSHVIIGLPGESDDMILETVKHVAASGIHGIKLQLLHILTDTDLYTYYQQHPFRILTMDEYITIIVKAITLLPPDMVIHRLTGDGPKSLVYEPRWSLNKRLVLGTISKNIKESSIYQGQHFLD